MIKLVVCCTLYCDIIVAQRVSITPHMIAQTRKKGRINSNFDSNTKKNISSPYIVTMKFHIYLIVRALRLVHPYKN